MQQFHDNGCIWRGFGDGAIRGQRYLQSYHYRFISLTKIKISETKMTKLCFLILSLCPNFLKIVSHYLTAIASFSRLIF